MPDPELYDDRPVAAKVTARMAAAIEDLGAARRDLDEAEERVRHAQAVREGAVARAAEAAENARHAWDALAGVVTEAHRLLSPFLTVPQDGEEEADDVEADYAAPGDGADAASLVDVVRERDREQTGRVLDASRRGPFGRGPAGSR